MHSWQAKTGEDIRDDMLNMARIKVLPLKELKQLSARKGLRPCSNKTMRDTWLDALQEDHDRKRARQVRGPAASHYPLYLHRRADN